MPPVSEPLVGEGADDGTDGVAALQGGHKLLRELRLGGVTNQGN